MLRLRGHRGAGISNPADHLGVVVDVALLLVLVGRQNGFGRLLRLVLFGQMLLQSGDLLLQLLLPGIKGLLGGVNLLLGKLVVPRLGDIPCGNAPQCGACEKGQRCAKFTHCSPPLRL